MENQIGKKIKTLRIDNGIKYESNEFNDFCREAGIKRGTTVPYTFEQNGVAESEESNNHGSPTHAMIYDQGLPKFLCEETANIVVYVQNRSLHQALDFLKMPEEVFTVKKPDVSHFRIFGCSVYFHVPKEKRNKLDAFGKKNVTFDENTALEKGRDVEVSRDDTFDENNALGKARDVPLSRKDDDGVAKSQEESLMDEPMSDVDGPTDPIDPPPGDPSTLRKRPLWLKDTLEEAVKHQVWKDAMSEKNESIMKNDVWDVVLRPKDKVVVTSKWLYKIKHGVDGSVEKYKAKFVARGFSKKEGVDYDEIFPRVV
eukprot:PITA_09786